VASKPPSSIANTDQERALTQAPEGTFEININFAAPYGIMIEEEESPLI
jgi:hypothetical protein